MGKGGGGGDNPPPLKYEAPPDPWETMGPVIEQMNSQILAFAQMAATPPAVPEMPEPIVTPTIDWEAKREELRAAALKEQEQYAKSRKGLASTILTGNTEDEEATLLVTRATSPAQESILTG